MLYLLGNIIFIAVLTVLVTRNRLSVFDALTWSAVIGVIQITIVLSWVLAKIAYGSVTDLPLVTMAVFGLLEFCLPVAIILLSEQSERHSNAKCRH